METNAQRPSQSEEITELKMLLLFFFPSLKSFSLTQAEQTQRRRRRRRSENISNIRGKLVRTSVCSCLLLSEAIFLYDKMNSYAASQSTQKTEC